VHNLAGKIYLFFIVPFHRTGVRSLLANASGGEAAVSYAAAAGC